MTIHTEKLVKEKQHAWIKYLNTKHPDHFQLYREARNKVTHALAADRMNYEKSIADEIRHNIKAFWKYVNGRKETVYLI